MKRISVEEFEMEKKEKIEEINDLIDELQRIKEGLGEVDDVFKKVADIEEWVFTNRDRFERLRYEITFGRK